MCGCSLAVRDTSFRAYRCRRSPTPVINLSTIVIEILLARKVDPRPPDRATCAGGVGSSRKREERAPGGCGPARGWALPSVRVPAERGRVLGHRTPRVDFCKDLGVRRGTRAEFRRRRRVSWLGLLERLGRHRRGHANLSPPLEPRGPGSSKQVPEETSEVTLSPRTEAVLVQREDDLARERVIAERVDAPGDVRDLVLQAVEGDVAVQVGSEEHPGFRVRGKHGRLRIVAERRVRWNPKNVRDPGSYWFLTRFGEFHTA